MLKRIFTLLVVLTLISSANASVKDTLPAFIGISYVPSLNWKVFFINHESIGKPLNLDFKMSSMSSYEGNIGIRKIGIRLGINAQMENNIIGKVYKWGGYLGFRNMMLRLQKSEMKGMLEWTGALPDEVNYYRTKSFSNSYFNIDLIKIAKKKRYIDGKWVVDPMENQMGFYWGVGYTSMGYPIEISTLVTEGGRENQKFGVPVYDTLYRIKSYNACFGFDLLRQLCMTGGRYSITPGRPAMRFAVYAITQDKIGFGSGKLTDYSVKMAEALNPGKTVVDDKFFNVMVHYTLSVGFRYYFRTGPAAFIFAAGYDFEGAMCAPFGGAADTDKDLGFDFINYYLNHGVSFKIYVAWNKNWE